MDHTAIQEIGKNAVAAAKEFATNCVPITALPSNVAVVNLEKYFEHRARFRGAFNTPLISEFVRYVNEQLEGKCFIDMDTMQARAIFDLGTVDSPGHAEHSAILALQKTAAYKAVLEIAQYEVSQKRLAEWLEDWREYIQAHNESNENIAIKSAIDAIRRVTINANNQTTSNEEQFRSKRTALEEIEAVTSHGMPSFLYFTCAPYFQLSECVTILRVSIIQDSDKLKFRLSMVKPEEAEQIIAQDFQSQLCRAISIPTFIGTFVA